MRTRFLVVAAFLLIACGAADDEEAAKGPPEPTILGPMCPSINSSAPAPAPAPIASPQRVRRLADSELDAVLSDLLGEKVVVSTSLIADPRVDGYDTDARGLVVSGPKLDGYIAAIEPIAAKIASRAPCTLKEIPRTCAENLVRSLAPRAWGRPITEDEVARLMTNVYAAGEGGPHANGMRLVAMAILLSPSMLYREEIGQLGQQPPQHANEGAVLDDFEIASQLSFLLTGRRPDEALRLAAERGELRDPDAIRPHAERLLATRDARVQMRRFITGWLELGKLGGVRRGGAYKKVFSPKVRDAMIAQLDRFIDDVVFEEHGGDHNNGGGGGTLTSLLTAPSGPHARTLDAIYADDAAAGTKRRGILMLPAFLTGHATRDGTNPVDRGLFVRTRLLCQELGPPPLRASAMPVDPLADKATTTREKFARHSTEPLCQGCHEMIDPVGFSFEGYDAIGKRRTTENGMPVDESGVLSMSNVIGDFHGPAELVDLILETDDLRTCFVAQLYRFAEGRREADICELSTMKSHFVHEDQERVRDLMLSYVTRREFFVREREKEKRP